MRAAELDATLSALADPTRRGVVELLRSQPRCAGELAAAFAVSPPAMSRHLRVLRTRGLVEEERSGEDARVRLYRLRREPFEALRRWIEEVDAQRGDSPGSFRTAGARRGRARRRRP